MEYIKEFGKECYLAFPYIQREKILEGKEAELENLAGCLDGFLVRNLEELGYLNRLGLAKKQSAITPYMRLMMKRRLFWRIRSASHHGSSGAERR